MTALPALGYLLYPALTAGRSQRVKLVFQNPADVDSTSFVLARLEGQEETTPGVFYKLEAGSPFVLSATCTHAGCAVNWQPTASEFVCPCHGGHFDASGRNISGPPPKPLARMAAQRVGQDVYVTETAA